MTLDELSQLMGMRPIQRTQHSLCDALVERGIARSRGQAKRLCIQKAITVNGEVELDFNRGVSYRDDIKEVKG